MDTAKNMASLEHNVRLYTWLVEGKDFAQDLSGRRTSLKADQQWRKKIGRAHV